MKQNKHVQNKSYSNESDKAKFIYRLHLQFYGSPESKFSKEKTPDQQTSNARLKTTI